MLNTMARLPRRLASDLNAKLRSPEVAGVVAGIEGKLTQRRRDQKMQSGAFRGVHVIVYRGFVADDVARVRVRVIEAPELPGDSRIPYWEVAQANVRRHAALHIVGAEVELRIGRHAATEITDDHGFANFTLPVRGPARRMARGAGRRPRRSRTCEPASGTGSVVKPSLRAPFLVISDIDDTILLTGLTEGVAMVTRTLLRDAEERRAIPGMAALYRGLARGLPNSRRQPQAGADLLLRLDRQLVVLFAARAVRRVARASRAGRCS